MRTKYVDKVGILPSLHLDVDSRHHMIGSGSITGYEKEVNVNRKRGLGVILVARLPAGKIKLPAESRTIVAMEVIVFE